jgi:cytochrome c-type biogenesis protein
MKRHSYTIAVLGFICLSLIFVPITYANSVTIQYFHQKGCLDCEITDPIINQTEARYKNNNVVVSRIETSTVDGFNQWSKYGFLEVPAIVMNNETKVPKEEITEEKLKTLIDEHLAEEENITEYTTEEATRKEQENEYINTDLNLPFAHSLGLLQVFHPA